MAVQNAPSAPEQPDVLHPVANAAIDAAMVSVAFLLASGAVVVVLRQLPMPDWYVLILGNIVAFYFGRRTR